MVVQLRADALKAKLDEPGRAQGRVPREVTKLYSTIIHEATV